MKLLLQQTQGKVVLLVHPLLQHPDPQVMLQFPLGHEGLGASNADGQHAVAVAPLLDAEADLDQKPFPHTTLLYNIYRATFRWQEVLPTLSSVFPSRSITLLGSTCATALQTSAISSLCGDSGAAAAR